MNVPRGERRRVDRARLDAELSAERGTRSAHDRPGHDADDRDAGEHQTASHEEFARTWSPARGGDDL